MKHSGGMSDASDANCIGVDGWSMEAIFDGGGRSMVVVMVLVAMVDDASADPR